MKKANTSLMELTKSAINFGTHRSQSIDHLAALASKTRGFSLQWHDPDRAIDAVFESLGMEGA